MNSNVKAVVKLPHHEPQEYCLNRPPYRQGRKLTAVKVYTVNNESQHLIVFGVPQIKLKDELHRLAFKFGIIKSLTQVNNYQRSNAEEEESNKFTDVFHLHYRRIQAARFAKRQLDERCFFGGVLHVCYAPELESVLETRTKLIQRRREVAARIEINKNSNPSNITKKRVLQRSRKRPALPVTEERFQQSMHNISTISYRNVTATAAGTPSSSFVDNQVVPFVIKPSPSPLLLEVCNAENGSLSQPNQFNDYTTVMDFKKHNSSVSQQPKPISEVVNKTLSLVSPVHNIMGAQPTISNHSHSFNTPLPISNEEIKTLCFIPRQISFHANSEKNISKKRIVFHNKKK